MQPNVSAAQNGIASGRDTRINIDRSQWLLSMVLAASDPAPPPNPDSEHLGDCPHCGRKWLSKFALMCVGCGYSAQYAREAELQARRFRIELTLVAVCVLMVAFGATPPWDVAVQGTDATRVLHAMGTVMKGLGALLAVVAAVLWAKSMKGLRTARREGA